MFIACIVTMNCGISSKEISNSKIIFKHLHTDSVNHQIFKWEDIEF